MPNPKLKDAPTVTATESNIFVLVVDLDGDTGEFKRISFEELTKALTYAVASELTAGTEDDKVVAPDVIKSYVNSVVDTKIATHLSSAIHA